MDLLNALPISSADTGMVCAAAALLLTFKVGIELAAARPLRRRRRKRG